MAELTFNERERAKKQARAKERRERTERIQAKIEAWYDANARMMNRRAPIPGAPEARPDDQSSSAPRSG